VTSPDPTASGSAPEPRGAVPGRGPAVAPLLAAVVLLAVGVASLGLLGGPLSTGGIPGAATVGDVPNRTPDPVKVFVPDVARKPHVNGTIAFAKAGNIWTVSGDDGLSQLTTTGLDHSPAWSPDGGTLYFLQVKAAHGAVPCSMIAVSGCITAVAGFDLSYPVLSSMPAAGGAMAELTSGLYTWGGGRYAYFYGLWQPAISSDGHEFAVISDAPNPLANDYRVEIYDTKTSQLTRLPLAADFAAGHNDPAWSPDGMTIAYSYNHREGTIGRPRIALYNTRTHTSKFLTDFGYAQPSYSPDGRSMAAVRTTNKGRDLVILSASTGQELLRLTNDGHSFAPVWSPAGDQIAFLRARGLNLDLWVATLTGRAPTFSVAREDPLTSQSLLDGTSKPAWFISPDQMPAPSAPASAGSPASSGVP
jgi:Tol biopolymer transport system component